jgi:hypothetical protein
MAPLVGSSAVIAALRERIARVAATDFTVMIEGGIGPRPHPSQVSALSATEHEDRTQEGVGQEEKVEVQRNRRHRVRLGTRNTVRRVAARGSVRVAKHGLIQGGQ